MKRASVKMREPAQLEPESLAAHSGNAVTDFFGILGKGAENGTA